MDLAVVEEVIKPKITTRYINDAAEKFILQQHAIPAFKGFYGFPAALCISVKKKVVHGISGDRALQEGDIVSDDRILSAHYENTLAIMDDGPEILTTI
ncbi:MAG: M24 family metallopeptidase [Methanobacterium paludis]|nr:M24 family metallopeptidase [Methanobacterium paludis]